MTAFTVRPAIDEDRKGVAELFSAWDRHEMQAGAILDYGFHDGRFHFVALLEDSVVGYANLTDSPVSTSGPYLTEADGAHCIPDMVVHADHRSKGIGKLLLNNLESHARTLGASGIFVSIDGGGNVAKRLKFFTKRGFRAVENPGYPAHEWCVPYCVKKF